jgi:hypothetical protein
MNLTFAQTLDLLESGQRKGVSQKMGGRICGLAPRVDLIADMGL